MSVAQIISEMPDIPNISEKLEWTISVSLLRNPLIRQQLGIAIGIPFGILGIVLVIVKAWYALMLIAALILLTALLIAAIWGGKYHAGFELSLTGVRNYTEKSQARKNRILNILTIIAGFLGNKPAVAGAAVLAASRNDVTIAWRRIKKVKFYPRSRTILLHAGYLESVALFCNANNYIEVEEFVRNKASGKDVVTIIK